MSNSIFTVGHSTHPINTFVELLRRHGVAVVADVRSAPYSRFNPQFNREALSKALAKHGIRYLFVGRELGARSKDPVCYKDGQVQYARLASTGLFRRGLDRVIQEAENCRVALMCAEKEPLDCHRTILVGRELLRHGTGVVHILASGRLESHDKAMGRLLTRLGINEPNLFFSRADLIERAYDVQATRIAYEPLANKGIFLGRSVPGSPDNHHFGKPQCAQ